MSNRAVRTIARSKFALATSDLVETIEPPRVSFASRETSRRRVLYRLGLASLVSTAFCDIAEGHRLHAKAQGVPGRFEIEGLKIEAPAGVYHPGPSSSSMMFVRTIGALKLPRLRRALEIGAGSGAISLTLAARHGAEVLATDISAAALESIGLNARRNGLSVKLRRSDLFAEIEEREFDLVVFNVPLIDKEPEDDLEGGNLCDPGGRLLERFAAEVGEHLAVGGRALFSLCSNSAYEVLDGADLDLSVVAFELGGDGFWRAVIAGKTSA